MKKLLSTLSSATAALCSTLLFTSSAHAQEVTNLPDGAHHAVGLETGVDSAVIARAAYSYRLRPSFSAHDLLLQSAFTLPIAEPDLADSRFETGFRTTAVAYENLRLQFGFGLLLHNTKNPAFAANALGVSAVLLPGYQSEHWGLMAELGYEKILATHLRPSDLYREKGYAAAKSGWYADTAGNFRLGLRGGVRLGAVELNTRLGMLATEGLNLRTPPFYVTLGAAYAF